VKLSSKSLKDFIGVWLSKPYIREDLQHHSEMDDPKEIVKGYGGNSDETMLEYHKRMFEAPKSVSTPGELEEHIWKMWCDGSRWKREEKRLLKDEGEDKFSTTEYIDEWKPGLPENQQERRRIPYFDIDMIGEANMELVTKFHNDPKQAAKCIFRCFVPDNQLADYYRLEVVTTPDDTEVIGWTVIVD